MKKIVSFFSRLQQQDASTHFAGVRSNITARQEQRTQAKLMEQVFVQATESIIVTDATGTIVRVNKAFTRMTGYSADEVQGQNPRMLASGLQDKNFFTAMWSALLQTGTWSGEIYNRRKDGAVYPEWLTISALRDEQGMLTHFLSNSIDLSSEKAAESRIQKLSHYDQLTGLPNYVLLQDRATHSINMVQRAKKTLSVLLVSIDQFKTLSDTHGHSVGDQVLVKMAARLSAALRKQDTAAHQSGEEFTLVLPDTSADGAAHLASELLWKIAQPYLVESQEINITASIGITTYPSNGADFDTLHKSAAIALHRAQAAGRGNFQFYTDSLYKEVMARDHMVKALRTAADHGEMHVVYQPFVDLQTGKINGMEALLRWTHPELGSIGPDVFIPIAEEQGLIRDIGNWVLRQVCADLRSWLDEGLEVPQVAVNVSPVQFRTSSFVALVKKALQDYRIEPTRMYLEITESALMTDGQHCESILQTLKEMGLGLSLDDFGTGYSSLSYLKRYPFDKVKIDQSFVRDVGTNSADLLLVKIIISMAHGLGLKVIAEGVETEAQCEIMRSNVCDEIQGFLFSRPVPAAAFKALLQENKQLPAHLLRFRQKQRALLLVDDEPNVLSALKRLFRQDGYDIWTASSGNDGLALLAQQKIDVIISDQRMPGMTGVEFLRAAKQLYPETIRIVLSGYTELQSVTDAINEGAIYRFLTKPWDDEQLRNQVTEAFEHKELLEQNLQLDIKIRTANQELVAANRHLGTLITSTQQQIEADSTSLSIVREVLGHIPTPILGIDDENVIILVNPAAEVLLHSSGPLWGVEMGCVSPALLQLIGTSANGQAHSVQIDKAFFNVQWNAMGQTSRSRGTLITLSHTTTAT